jgi:hypothetical protein
MFLIDEHGERPICKACHKPFVATPEQIRAFRREHPRICHRLSGLHHPRLRQTGDSPAKGVCRCHLKSL